MSETEEIGDAAKGKKASPKIAEKYNEFKEWGGKKYTGMKVGGRHKWLYDGGEWRETKVAPDDWEFAYSVNKRRKGKAPEDSGAPVGTEYHWYILGHQFVKKLDANTYSTNLEGLKVKIAHKRADKETWASSDKAQMKKVLKTLEQAAASLREELGMEPVEVGPKGGVKAKVVKGEHLSEGAPMAVSPKKAGARVRKEAPQRSRRVESRH